MTIAVQTERRYNHTADTARAAHISNHRIQKGIKVNPMSGIFLILAALLLAVMMNAKPVSAVAPVEMNRYFTSVTVSDDDTLWSLAEKNYNASTENKKDYIDSVMKMNHMTDTNIHSGQNLVIYYWAE